MVPIQHAHHFVVAGIAHGFIHRSFEKERLLKVRIDSLVVVTPMQCVLFLGESVDELMELDSAANIRSTKAGRASSM